jgi:hypothetical protein
MNWVEIEENWEEMQGLLRSYWVRLTSDDLVAIDRSRTRLVETLQRVYKLTEPDATSAVCYFEKTVRKPGGTI